MPGKRGCELRWMSVYREMRSLLEVMSEMILKIEILHHVE